MSSLADVAYLALIGLNGIFHFGRLKGFRSIFLVVFAPILPMLLAQTLFGNGYWLAGELFASISWLALTIIVSVRFWRWAIGVLDPKRNS